MLNSFNRGTLFMRMEGGSYWIEVFSEAYCAAWLLYTAMSRKGSNKNDYLLMLNILCRCHETVCQQLNSVSLPRIRYGHSVFLPVKSRNGALTENNKDIITFISFFFFLPFHIKQELWNKQHHISTNNTCCAKNIYLKILLFFKKKL